ncbi:PREDICTED: uncharacterized protein C14orf105 homolog isoform X2 [Crocodylus porosus]|uniref:uncharacterized protein C14orf105 homolog isoform X2 n=1 Tax=Crocodylus porosus TaxID=8502 RepID=UPI00093E9A77|nr:PREDICTED: uncharacterized protein C14orf105 homolog isoform X2 [Crocodylus porosus]
MLVLTPPGLESRLYLGPAWSKHLPDLKELTQFHWPPTSKRVALQFGRAVCANDTAASLLIQKLEPIDLPPVITSEARWRLQEQEGAQKAKDWEKRVQAVTHSTGRRQHLHKLQMLELNRKRQEAEMKRGHHREAKLKQKAEELKPEKAHGRIWRNSSSDSEDRVPVEPAQAYTKDHRTTWDGEFLEQYQMFESHPRQSSKVEMWSLKQQAAKELFWDSSSTDSEDWKSGERKLYHRPALVRTKTERISLFDEFFDKHF